jgi:hypothetical protein
MVPVEVDMSYIFYSSVSKPFLQTKEMLVWAKVHCPSYITNDVEKRENDWYYRFYFGQEKDYVFFRLRYG